MKKTGAEVSTWEDWVCKTMGLSNFYSCLNRKTEVKQNIALNLKKDKGEIRWKIKRFYLTVLGRLQEEPNINMWIRNCFRKKFCTQAESHNEKLTVMEDTCIEGSQPAV